MGGAEAEGPQGTVPELSPGIRHGTGRFSWGGPFPEGGKGVAVAGGSPAALVRQPWDQLTLRPTVQGHIYSA